MIRTAGAIWLVLVASLVAGLFHSKQKVQIIERRLTSIDRTIAADRRAIEVLEAEWTYLNRPDRLARLSKRFLRLQQVTPNNVRAFSDLPYRFGPAIRIERSADAQASQ